MGTYKNINCIIRFENYTYSVCYILINCLCSFYYFERWIAPLKFDQTFLYFNKKCFQELNFQFNFYIFWKLHQIHPLSQYHISTSFSEKKYIKLNEFWALKVVFFFKNPSSNPLLSFQRVLVGLSSILFVWRRKICSEACFETRYKRNGSNFRAQTTVIYHYFVIGFVPVPPPHTKRTVDLYDSIIKFLKITRTYDLFCWNGYLKQ